MCKKTKFFIMLSIIILALILSVIGFIILPDTLIMQITTTGTNGTTMPKILGLVITFTICSVFSVLYYNYDNNIKYLLLSIVGICLYGFMFIVNL